VGRRRGDDCVLASTGGLLYLFWEMGQGKGVELLYEKATV